jgi:hypothetical protein
MDNKNAVLEQEVASAVPAAESASPAVLTIEIVNPLKRFDRDAEIHFSGLMNNRGRFWIGTQERKEVYKNKTYFKLKALTGGLSAIFREDEQKK